MHQKEREAVSKRESKREIKQGVRVGRAGWRAGGGQDGVVTRMGALSRYIISKKGKMATYTYTYLIAMRTEPQDYVIMHTGQHGHHRQSKVGTLRGIPPEPPLLYFSDLTSPTKYLFYTLSCTLS